MEKASGQKVKMKKSALSKETTLKVKKKAMESSSGRLVTSTEASIKMTREMDMVRCTGLIIALTKEAGSKVFSTVKV